MSELKYIFPVVDLCTAAADTKRWRTEQPNGLKGFYIPLPELNSIHDIITGLQVPGMVVFGLRIYNGLAIPGQIDTHRIYIVPVLQPILDPVTNSDVLCLNTANGTVSTIYGPAYTCQPFCSTTFNPLNDSDLSCIDFTCPPAPDFPPITPPPGSSRITSVCDAATATANWRALPEHYPQGFFIPILDFEHIMHLSSDHKFIIGVRLYNALTIEGGAPMHHLYIVPVGAQPVVTEMVLVPQVTGSIMNAGDILCLDGESVIYDTTTPCPVMCGLANPLNFDIPCAQVVCV